GASLSFTPWLSKLVNDMSISYLSGYYKLDDKQAFGMGIRYFNLGDIHWAAGEVEEAKKYYQRSSDSFSISSLGGEYREAPRRRLRRMAENDIPEFVLKSWSVLGLTSQSTRTQ
ncbi:MAG: hypothetical protein MI867_03860, partial [Pseudomonadales bacterium]|nr:hypothetical protein [Pseudomonadales bacterium]